MPSPEPSDFHARRAGILVGETVTEIRLSSIGDFRPADKLRRDVAIALDQAYLDGARAMCRTLGSFLTPWQQEDLVQSLHKAETE